MERLLKTAVVLSLLLGSLLGNAQQRVVSGTVTTEADGIPLEGVSVILENTSTGTTTDAAGKYSLNVPSGNHRLIFSYQGYLTQTISVTSNTVNVRLVSNVEELSNVVVTALGITRAEKSLTYAAQVVRSSDLDVAKETNVINSLEGKVSGVVINRSATGPGGSSKVVLRGIRSITSGNEPL